MSRACACNRAISAGLSEAISRVDERAGARELGIAVDHYQGRVHHNSPRRFCRTRRAFGRIGSPEPPPDIARLQPIGSRFP